MADSIKELEAKREFLKRQKGGGGKKKKKSGDGLGTNSKFGKKTGKMIGRRVK